MKRMKLLNETIETNILNETNNETIDETNETNETNIFIFELIMHSTFYTVFSQKSTKISNFHRRFSDALKLLNQSMN